MKHHYQDFQFLMILLSQLLVNRLIELDQGKTQVEPILLFQKEALATLICSTRIQTKLGVLVKLVTRKLAEVEKLLF